MTPGAAVPAPQFAAVRSVLCLRTLARLAAAFCLAGALGACATVPADEERIGSLRLIGEQRMALMQPFAGTTAGGLSGIDYDAASGQWLMESDDRSAIDPARFYGARMDIGAHGFTGMTLTDVYYWRQPDGSTYPNLKTRSAADPEVPDIESLRIDPRDGTLWYTSEGDRRLGLDPFVRHARRDGSYLATLPLPALFKVSATHEQGPRNNLTFEGLSFAADGNSLWVSMEAPLYEDGPLPTPTAGAVARVTQFDRAGAVLAQYAYPLDPLPMAPAPGKAADNGISEVLALNGGALLVLERAGIQGADGSYRNAVRLYEMQLAGATDVQSLPALAGATYRAATKRLVLDLNTLGLERLDNLESLSWGPRLPNGHRTLMIASDDNFNKNQVTQFLLFEVLP